MMLSAVISGQMRCFIAGGPIVRVIIRQAIVVGVLIIFSSAKISKILSQKLRYMSQQEAGRSHQIMCLSRLVWPKRDSNALSLIGFFVIYAIRRP